MQEMVLVQETKDPRMRRWGGHDQIVFVESLVIINSYLFLWQGWV